MRKEKQLVSPEEVDVDVDEYNRAYVVGHYYEVFDSLHEPRCLIRITVMELCRWNKIPERLWKGETNQCSGV
ncbi:hypothetical protein GF326_09375 [Candidatus Bathyarchaeota archaeon]|nr:hypothetical protein [Candidatus Bathyarchaeota archaeon]